METAAFSEQTMHERPRWSKDFGTPTACFCSSFTALVGHGAMSIGLAASTMGIKRKLGFPALVPAHFTQLVLFRARI
jgi:hypothetical protein